MGALSAKKGTADHVHNNDNDSHGLPDMFRWPCIVMHFLRRRDQVCARGPGTCRTERTLIVRYLLSSWHTCFSALVCIVEMVGDLSLIYFSERLFSLVIINYNLTYSSSRWRTNMGTS